EMGPVKRGLRLAFNRLTDNTRNLDKLLLRRIVGHTDRKHDAPALQPFEIVQAGVGEVRVGKNQLLTGKRSYPCGLDPNGFDRAAFVLHHHEITHFKRAVKKQYKIIEKVCYDILRSQCNSDSANAEPRQQRGYIIPQ